MNATTQAPRPRTRGESPSSSDLADGSTSAASQTRLTQTVKTALQILRSFTPEAPARGVNEIADELGIHKSSISRLLATLEEERLVRREPGTERYQLSLGLLELAGVLLNQLDLRVIALPYLRQLVSTAGEAVSLAVWDDDSMMLIEHLPSPHPISYLGRVGHRTPAHCSSGGKVLLAFSSPARVQSVIDAGLQRFTDRTLTTDEALKRDLAAIRERGYSINAGEFWDGAYAVAAPIWDINGTVVGAVSLVGPAFRFTEDLIPHYGELVKQTAAQISRQLGAPSAVAS